VRAKGGKVKRLKIQTGFGLLVGVETALIFVPKMINDLAAAFVVWVILAVGSALINVFSDKPHWILGELIAMVTFAVGYLVTALFLIPLFQIGT
jgi:hypothetical protein